LRESSNRVTGTECTSADIGVNANLELMDKFCYLADMLNVDGDAYAAVENRIRTDDWGQSEYDHSEQYKYL